MQIKEKTKLNLKHFLMLLGELQKIDSEFPLQYAVCLTEIALDEGLSLTALSERTRIPLPTISRIAGALSSQRQKGIAFGLVHVRVSAQERRRKEIFLTARGKAVTAGITELITYQMKKRR